MRLGVTMFATDLSMPVTELARAVEERGLASLYLPEHTHMPVSTAASPMESPLPEQYKRTLDPLVALAAAAAVTERITLGTGILLAAQRDPIVTAKAIATLDHLAPGRVAVGVGFGWNRAEVENHGVPYESRRAVVRRNVLAMKALWSQEVAAFDGFEPSWSWPKPSRMPPVYLGGAAGPKLFAHIAEYADGWIPIGGRGVKAALPALRQACGDRPVRVIPFGSRPTPEKLEYFASLGIDEVVANVPGGPVGTVLPALDELAAIMAAYVRDHPAPR
ncbi:TIGR03619 family F420-dependent LLM class oxidoreductase [Thermoactinospora rubra]|uniref:TIGR03619 family F420-dependent LLM class oxidoreductase n=1 Tax=Thermoactinospora rubra TaxID=1088767 RepID=UPI000A10E70F|nr:TIGR03619 family F420-dependent LLM class oxidoreductase [Thermoactinospora rubra]